MKVEIWSDIMCPFCYIGKRNFEKALEQLPGREHIDVEWKSFQLDPSAVAVPGKTVHEYLAERKGFSHEQSVQMHRQVTDTARAAGLDYHFEKAVIANSFDAHRLIQLAKTKGLGDAAEEALFSAYFTEGKNISDKAVLTDIAKAIGLDEKLTTQTLEGTSFSDAVESDIEMAGQIGVRGVPFFVFNSKYAVSGAQPPAVFEQALNTSYNEWRDNTPISLATADGASCTTDGDCN